MDYFGFRGFQRLHVSPFGLILQLNSIVAINPQSNTGHLQIDQSKYRFPTVAYCLLTITPCLFYQIIFAENPFSFFVYRQGPYRQFLERLKLYLFSVFYFLPPAAEILAE